MTVLAQRFGFQGHPHVTAVTGIFQGAGNVGASPVQKMQAIALLAGAGTAATAPAEYEMASALLAGAGVIAGNVAKPVASFVFPTSGLRVPIGTTVASSTVSNLIATTTASVSGGTASKVSNNGSTFGATASIPVNGTVYVEQTVNTFNTNSTCTVTIGAATATFEVSTCTQPSFTTLTLVGLTPGGPNEELIQSTTNSNLAGTVSVTGAGASVSNDNVHFSPSCSVAANGQFYILVACPSGFGQTANANITLNGYTQNNVVSLSTQNLPTFSGFMNVGEALTDTLYSDGFTITTDSNCRGILTLAGSGLTSGGAPPPLFDFTTGSITLIGARSNEGHALIFTSSVYEGETVTATGYFQCLDMSNNPVGPNQAVFTWSITTAAP